jgi:acetyl-CoA/propionyl-CoA carboxylase biotin carboxyl carrier protein
MPEELTPRQAAARIGATTRSIQRWIASGKLPARRVGGRWRVAIDALDAFSRATAAPAAETPSKPRRPIRTVFIANRGEIANRISRTCHKLGIAVVRAGTEDDGSVEPAVRGADAIDLLDGHVVIAAAVAAGADAIHPGYGFLAENAEFAEAVEAAGMVWIGPPADAMRRMGDKAAARQLATELGVPVVPGYDEPDQSDEDLAAAAKRIGYPILIKPAAGGGGKGMRTVRSEERLPDELAAARREAKAAFGDDRLILERLIEGPRHVEIQVLFDAHGAGVHLGERDCSIQRRHQKVLEETPSPAVDAKLRAAMADSALRLAHAVGYVSAGTCEFLVEDRGRFYFLEMNTRLQVEHPVTELVTGRDLVADQIRIATGEPLGFDQGDVRADGHAVEVRLYAEDAENGFLPATGRVERLRWEVGEGVRIDAGIEVGSVVGGQFDPMLAKLIAHGSTRAEAFHRLAYALDETVLLGLVTNLRFLRWLARQPAVLEGQARIDTLDRIWPPDDWAERVAIPDEAWSTAAWMLQPNSRDPWQGGWRMNAPAALRITSGDETRALNAVEPEMPRPAVTSGARVFVDVYGRSVAFELAPPPDVDRAARAAASHAGGGASEITAPMPGSVLAVHVREGEEVEAGAPIITIEAMKMEHVVAAPGPGRIADLAVRRGDQMARGEPIAVVEPVESDATR